VPILSNPALKILLSCLESVWQEYERYSILKLLSSSYLAVGIWGDPDGEPGSVLRDLLELTRVSRGDEEWLYRLEKLKEEVTRGSLWERYTGLYQRDFLSARLESYREKPEELLRICDGVVRLIDVLRDVPQSSTLKGYVEVLFQLSDKLRLVEGILSQKGNEVKDRDLRALQAFWDCLGSWEDCLSGEDYISLVRFQSLIRSILRAITYRARIGNEGGADLIDPLEKRHHSSIVTVVCGMVEGFFAVTPSKQGLLSDPLRLEINKIAKREALKLSTRGKMEDDLIFDILLFRTAGRLVMTYPTLDSQSREVIRSRYLDRLVEGKSKALTRIPPTCIIPGASRIYERKELIRYLIPTLMSGEGWQSVKDSCKRLKEFQTLLSGVRGRILIEIARKSGTGKGYDGQLVREEVLKDLGERFGENCIYTPSLLGNYITCPFLFMVGDVWGMEGREYRGIGMSSSDKGRIIHRILNLFYRHFLEEGSFSWDVVEGGLPILEEIADSILGEYYEVDYFGPRGLMDIQAKELKRELLDFVLKDIEFSREIRATPLLLEYAIYTEEEDVCLETTTGEIKIGGRVDRVDVLESPENGHIVMDYKTGYSASPREIREGRNLQVPLYIIGLEKKGFNILMGFYYHIKERKRKAEMGPGKELISQKSSTGDLDWDFIQELVIGKIGEVVTSITGGDFRANPSDCPSYCDLKDICRLESYRRRKKGWRRRA
jgi:ATP-dependent helicase/DNAse subunit B